MYFFYDSYGNLTLIKYYKNGNLIDFPVLTNSQGDVVAIYNTSGTKLISYEYDAWGNATISGSAAIGTLNPIRYRGYYYDSDLELYYLQSRYYDAEIGRFISADATLGQIGNIQSNNMFAYCYNNPIMLHDSTGYSPEWWQWVISGTMVVAGIALVASGVGGIAGGTLICAGANSMIGSYTSEAVGGSSFAGWVGGMITGTMCGSGAGFSGNLFIEATKATGYACIGGILKSLTIAYTIGFSGAAIGQSVSATIDHKKINTKDLLFSSFIIGGVNCVSSILSAVGTGLKEMSAISTTSTTLANSLTAACSLVSEVVCDFFGTITDLFF